MTAEFNFLQSLPAIAPEIGLTILAVVILLLDSYLTDAEHRRNIAYVSAAGMAFLAITPFVWAPPTQITSFQETLYWGGMIHFDPMAAIFKVMVLFAGAITSLLAIQDSGVRNKGEFHLIIIISTLGGCLLASAADLIMVFVALETVSIPLYILAAFRRTSDESAESGMKYFLFGSFASAILLYGFSLIYGFTGETNLYSIAQALTVGDVLGGNVVPVLVALLFVLVGFGFKISIAPFHFWTPDVYQGAPTPVTGFVSVASKAASFAVLTRFLVAAFGEGVVIDGQLVQVFWVNLIAVLAIVSMTLGNVMALRQSNIKRLLAYSSIAQAGYTLVGVAALSNVDALGNAELTFSVSAIAYYMFMYTFSNLLMFGGIIMFSEMAGSEDIKDYAGLQRRNPWLAFALTIGLLSLAGIPPAAGFFGKFFLFQAAVEANLTGLAIIGVINSIVALYYYLVVIKIMWVDESADADKPINIPPTYAWTLGITTVIVILLGVVPAPIIDWARNGAEVVTQTIALIAGL